MCWLNHLGAATEAQSEYELNPPLESFVGRGLDSPVQPASFDYVRVLIASTEAAAVEVDRERELVFAR